MTHYKVSAEYELIPIDHGYCLRSVNDASCFDWGLAKLGFHWFYLENTNGNGGRSYNYNNQYNQQQHNHYHHHQQQHVKQYRSHNNTRMISTTLSYANWYGIRQKGIPNVAGMLFAWYLLHPRFIYPWLSCVLTYLAH